MAKQIRKQTLIGAIALALFGLTYLLSADVRDFIAQSFAILSKADPGDIEGGIRELKSYLLGFGIWAPVVSSILMVLQMIAAPIPGQLVTFTNGLLFGAFWGTVLSWSSAMAGAALCYGIATAFGRPVVEKIVGVKSLDYVDRFFERYGTKAILVARLIPFVPFDPVSYGAGLTKMGFWRFFIATGIGQLPATILYSWLGAKVTGSIKVVFWVFVGVVALAVILSALKPWYEKRALSSRAGEGKSSEEPREKLPLLVVADKIFVIAFTSFLLGFDISWLLMKNIWFDMRMRTGILMPVFLIIGLVIGFVRFKKFTSQPKPMSTVRKIASWLLALFTAAVLAMIVTDLPTLQLVLPIQMREGFFMSDLDLEIAKTATYTFFLLGFWRLGATIFRRLRCAGRVELVRART